MFEKNKCLDLRQVEELEEWGHGRDLGILHNDMNSRIRKCTKDAGYGGGEPMEQWYL